MSLQILSFLISLPLIQSVEITGNQKTKPDVILQLSGLAPGQVFSDKLISDAREALFSSELYKSVHISNEGCETDASTNCMIRIAVEEKQSWFLFPFFYFSQNHIGGGLIFADANLLGGRERIFLVGNWGNQAKLGLLAFEDPQIFDSKWGYRFLGMGKEEEERVYLHREERYAVNVRSYGGALVPHYQWSKAFQTGLGFSLRKIKTTPDELGVGYEDEISGLDSAAIAEWKFDRMENHEGLPDGFFLGQMNRWAVGDFDYFRQENRLRYAHLFGERQWAWLSKLGFQFGRKLPFHEDLTAGGTNLRGFFEKEFRGDIKYSFNQEMYFPISRFKSLILRGLAFHDSQIIYFRQKGFDQDAWLNGSGLGVRLYLRNVVVPLLGFDFARGWEAKDWGFYFNVGIPEGNR